MVRGIVVNGVLVFLGDLGRFVRGEVEIGIEVMDLMGYKVERRVFKE